MTRRLLASGAFREAPVRIIDGGARHGAEGHWALFGDQLELFAFEPDEEECRRTMASVQNGPGRIRFSCAPVALAGTKGRARLNVARYPDSSSLLSTNDAFVDRFAMSEYLEQVGTTEIETTDLATFAAERELDYLDFIKLDVEGAELDALRGLGSQLERSLLGLSVEVWFQSDHLGRPLFADIDAHLRALGFALFDLRELNRWRRRTLAGPSYPSWIDSGQLMYGNALYLRDLPALLVRDGELRPSRVEVLKLASLAELFCYPDYAIEVLATAREVGILEPSDAVVLTSDLRAKTPAASGGWRALVRRAVRTLLPPKLRRRLMRVLQDLVAE